MEDWKVEPAKAGIAMPLLLSSLQEGATNQLSVPPTREIQPERHVELKLTAVRLRGREQSCWSPRLDEPQVQDRLRAALAAAPSSSESHVLFPPPTTMKSYVLLRIAVTEAELASTGASAWEEERSAENEITRAA